MVSSLLKCRFGSADSLLKTNGRKKAELAKSFWKKQLRFPQSDFPQPVFGFGPTGRLP
jgi:hypothetical protein